MTNILEKFNCKYCGKTAWSRDPFWNHPGCGVIAKRRIDAESKRMVDQIVGENGEDKCAYCGHLRVSHQQGHCWVVSQGKNDIFNIPVEGTKDTHGCVCKEFKE